MSRFSSPFHHTSTADYNSGFLLLAVRFLPPTQALLFFVLTKHLFSLSVAGVSSKIFLSCDRFLPDSAIFPCACYLAPQIIMSCYPDRYRPHFVPLFI